MTSHKCVVCADRPPVSSAYPGLCVKCGTQLDAIHAPAPDVYFALPDVAWAAKRARAAERRRLLGALRDLYAAAGTHACAEAWSGRLAAALTKAEVVLAGRRAKRRSG